VTRTVLVNRGPALAYSPSHLPAAGRRGPGPGECAGHGPEDCVLGAAGYGRRLGGRCAGASAHVPGIYAAVSHTANLDHFKLLVN
jgi:hypothetical protein